MPNSDLPDGARDRSQSRGVIGVYFGIVAGLLLLVIAVASGTQADVDIAPAEIPRVPKDVADVLYTVGIIIWIVGLPVGAALLLLARGPRKRLPYEQGLIAVVTVALVVGAASLLLARSIRLSDVALAPNFGTGSTDRDARDADGGNDGVTERSRSNVEFRWEVVGGLALVGATAAAVGLMRRRKDRQLVAEEAPSDLLGTVDLALDDLMRERDPRRAVVLAFGRLEQMFAERSLPRKVFETPLEYVTRILARPDLEGPEVERLANLFQLARFSSRRIDATMKDEAIGCLRRIRDQLEDSR